MEAAGDGAGMINAIQDIAIAYHDGKDLNASSSVGNIGSEAGMMDPTDREAGEEKAESLTGVGAGGDKKDGGLMTRATSNPGLSDGVGEDFESDKGGAEGKANLMADSGLIPEGLEDLFGLGADTTAGAGAAEAGGNPKSSGDGNLHSNSDGAGNDNGDHDVGLEVGGNEADDVSESYCCDVWHLVMLDA